MEELFFYSNNGDNPLIIRLPYNNIVITGLGLSEYIITGVPSNGDIPNHLFYNIVFEGIRLSKNSIIRSDNQLGLPIKLTGNFTQMTYDSPRVITRETLKGYSDFKIRITDSKGNDAKYDSIGLWFKVL